MQTHSHSIAMPFYQLNLFSQYEMKSDGRIEFLKTLEIKSAAFRQVKMVSELVFSDKNASKDTTQADSHSSLMQ